MPKPTKAESELESKKNWPEVRLLNIEGKEEIVGLLQQLHAIQEQVGVKPDDKKGKAGSGMLAVAHTIKQKLSSIIAVAGVPGLRHGNLVFSDCWIEGKATTDLKTLKIELVQAGCDLDVVNACIERATKTGDGYMRRMLVDLSKPKSGWED